jgi:hypothetical protein
MVGLHQHVTGAKLVSIAVTPAIRAWSPAQATDAGHRYYSDMTTVDLTTTAVWTTGDTNGRGQGGGARASSLRWARHHHRDRHRLPLDQRHGDVARTRSGRLDADRPSRPTGNGCSSPQPPFPATVRSAT